MRAFDLTLWVWGRLQSDVLCLATDVNLLIILLIYAGTNAGFLEGVWGEREKKTKY